MKKSKNQSLMQISVILAVVISSFLFVKCSGGEGHPNASKSEMVRFTPEQERELKADAKRFFTSVTELPGAEISEEKIALGKKLFYDTRLSKDGNISCNSCHNLKTYGVDNLPFSPGDTDELGGRNSPTVIYASLHHMQFWDGRAKDVEEQAGGPLLNPVEHNIPSEEFLEKRLQGIEDYRQLFSEIYPQSSEAITFANITDAIGAFERQLTPISRFDEWLDGDDNALNTEEKLGLSTFIDKGCIACHSGITLGGTMLQKFGINDDYWVHTKSKNIDNGRFDETQNENDKYYFKVPGLRNIEKTHPYFHDGSVDKLEDAVRIMGKLQTQSEMTEDDVHSIVTFLKSLTADVDEQHKEIN